MKSILRKKMLGLLAMVAMIGSVVAPVVGGSIDNNDSGSDDFGHKHGPPPPVMTKYRQVNFVSDISGIARYTDPNLVNPWGIVVVPSSGVLWIADNGTGLSTIYSKSGTVESLVVTVAPPAGSTNTSAPDGIVLNSTGEFAVSAGSNSASPLFIFSTEDGTVSGWSPKVNPTNSILMVDHSASNAVYKGIAQAEDSSSNQFLFVTNFRGGVVEKYDTNLDLVATFTDTNLPAGYAPFGIRNINGKLFVTFAVQDAAKHDDVAGPGNGFVDVFDADGTLLQQFAAQGTLNSPWGLAVAPSGFGEFSGAVLVGNFGDGTINAFAANTGTFLGQLTDVRGNVIAINSLWGLEFSIPPTATGGHKHHRDGDNDADDDVPGLTLYFTAGIGSEGHGLFGKITPIPQKHKTAFGHDD